MPPWFISRIVWISCFAVVLYAFSSNEESDAAPYLKKIDALKRSADQESLDIGDYEGVTAAINDSQEISGLIETDELEDEAIAMMNMPRCVAENKTGHCTRIKRTVQRVDVANGPNLCRDASMDTIVRTQDGSTYIFKGDHYWKVHNRAIPEGYPKLISADWDGLPGNIDASFTIAGNRTYFFKGSQYWRFVNKKMDRNYPKQISSLFKGIPNNLDAALSWRRSNKIYFFKGTKYWLFSLRSEPPVPEDYPKPISEKWGSLFESGIDAAFQWQNRRIYFFKGQQYYRYNVRTSQIDQINPPYPHSTATGWLRCG